MCFSFLSLIPPFIPPRWSQPHLLLSSGFCEERGKFLFDSLVCLFQNDKKIFLFPKSSVITLLLLLLLLLLPFKNFLLIRPTTIFPFPNVCEKESCVLHVGKRRQSREDVEHFNENISSCLNFFLRREGGGKNYFFILRLFKTIKLPFFCNTDFSKHTPTPLSFFSTFPTHNALLVNFRLSSDAEILLISTNWACKSAPNLQKSVCNMYIFQRSFHFAYHCCWLGWQGTYMEKNMTLQKIRIRPSFFLLPFY